MTWLQLVRLITLCEYPATRARPRISLVSDSRCSSHRAILAGFTLACGIIVLSLASHVTSLSEKYYAIYYAFEALGIAVGALTMLTIPVM